MNWITLLTPEALAQLERNHVEQLPVKGTRQEKDFAPVVKLFIPWGSGTWLLSELQPGTPYAFGLCDLGMQCPELGEVSLEELYSVVGPGGLRVEQDLHWKPSMTLRGYASAASTAGHIVA